MTPAKTWFSQSNFLQVLALLMLCWMAYASCLNNGFISDDYVNLRHAETAKSLWALFQSPPLNFRMTSFIAYSVLEGVFGGRYEFFYAANILLHFVNCLLLWELLVVIGRDRKEAYLAAVLFAVFQAPQEAVMWIAAMNETLLGLFVLSTILLWLKGYRFVAALCFLLALFSKESAPIVLLLIPIVQWQRGEKVPLRQMVPLLAPLVIFSAVFFWTWSGNSMIQHGVYAAGPHALLVLGRSLHLLFRPSFYVLLVVSLLATRRWGTLQPLPKFVVWIMVPMVPYAFLTYSPYIPSRQVYMASMVMVSVMAYFIRQFKQFWIQLILVMAFLAYNVGYMWLRNDPQFENRAAPTTQLVTLLRSHQPAPILLEGFPYPITAIAKEVSRFAPGWNRDFIHVNESCHDCVVFRWDAKTKSYAGNW
jgi:hypothetical protein